MSRKADLFPPCHVCFGELLFATPQIGLNNWTTRQLPVDCRHGPCIEENIGYRQNCRRRSKCGGLPVWVYVRERQWTSITIQMLE